MSELFERVSAFLESRAAQSDPAAELAALRQVDDAVRAVYRSLAEHPDRADAATTLLEELLKERRQLAERVGIDALRRLREELANVSPPLPVPSPDPVSPEPAGHEVAPASHEALAAFHEQFAARAPAADPPSSLLVLHELLERAGAPPSTTGDPDEVDCLVGLVNQETMETLLRLDNENQRSFLAMITVRIIAARSAGDVLTRERLYPLLATIREFSMRERPGTIHGLKRDHEPKYGSWLLDAEHVWHRLGGDVSELEPRSRSGAPRSKRTTEQERETEDRSPPEDWPLWPVVRGAAALMIGGEPREASRVRVERAFGLRELVWIPDEPRKVDSAVARVDSRGFDIVLVLTRFVSHSSSERLLAACSSSAVVGAHVERGYGVEQIRAALDRFLAPPATRSAP